MKQGTTVKPERATNSEVFDSWADGLDPSTHESFCSFCSDNYSIIECFLYARFLGYMGCISACDEWVKERYPKPDHRKLLLEEIAHMQEDIRLLRADIEDFGVKRDSGVARIAAMEKELRGTINQVEQYTNNKDKKGLLMAGADRAIRELTFIFKDDPIENPLKEACMSVWARMQLEE